MQLPDLELREDLFDDFALTPFQPPELEARLKHLFWRTGRGTRPELVEYGPLVLNLETYQAALTGRPLDLTYMEYELLKFLATHPGKVFTRETLLSRVWGYEYYGGARTVDVHVRRLRAKLGEEHASPDLHRPQRRLPLRPVPLGPVADLRQVSICCQSATGTAAGASKTGRSTADFGSPGCSCGNESISWRNRVLVVGFDQFAVGVGGFGVGLEGGAEAGRRWPHRST